MNIHQKQSECFGVVNVHCLLCVKAMECHAYLVELYPLESSELVQAPLSITPMNENCAQFEKGA